MFRKCLSIFLKASGLEIKSEKSQVFFFNISMVSQRNIIKGSSLQYKYLGAPLIEGVIKIVSCTDLLDRMRRNLTNWTLRPLNLASKVTLLKAVLQVMPICLFSIVGAPKVFLKEIRSIQRQFSWAGIPNKHKWALLAVTRFVGRTPEEGSLLEI